MKINDKPMMADQEIDYITNLIEGKMYESCLEWGSGMSTAYFPQNAYCIRNWLSIEHNGHYVQYLADHIDIATTRIIWVPNDAWYVDCVKHLGKIFDFILVDGENRERCVEIGLEILADGGTLLLHDSSRKEYQEWLKKYKVTQIFSGEKSTKDGFCAHRGLAKIEYSR